MIERVLNGDGAAFELLVLPYRRMMLTLAYRIVLNAEDAKEIAQEALIRAHKYLRHCDLERGFRNWLFQILVNAARKHRRMRSLESSWRSDDPLPDTSPAQEAGPAEIHEAKELHAQLLDCLGRVSPKEREVFLLRDIEHLSIEEAARALGLSPLSVRVHLSQARRKIKAEMKEKYLFLREKRP